MMKILKEEAKMRKFNITVNGKTYEVEVEEIGGASVAAPRPAAPAPKPAAPAPKRRRHGFKRTGFINT